MKLIIVSAQYIGSISGGGGVHVVELTRELGKLGHDILVLSMLLKWNKEKETVILRDEFNEDPKKRRAKVKVIRFKVKDYLKINSPFEGSKEEEINRLIEFKNKVLEWLIKHNGDEIVHLHGHFVVPSLAKDIKKHNLKYKIVNSIHTVESISEITKGKDGASKRFIKIMQDMEREAIEYSDYLILRSKKVLQQVKEFFPDVIKKTKVAIMPSAVSSVFIHHPPLSNKKLSNLKKRYSIKGDLILNINRIDPSKGIENLIKSFPKLYKYLLKKDKSVKLNLIIAGMIEEKNKWYYERLMNLINKIEEKSIRESIGIFQNISEEDKMGLFNLAKVFVLTSLLEPFGITIVEALAKDVPVIASGVEGPRDIMGVKEVPEPFKLAKGGILVNYDNPSKRANNLFEALKYCFTNYSKVKKIAKQGKIKTLEKYAWEALVKEKIKIYEKVKNE